MRTVTATRYVTPLREGGSLPAIVEADDDGLYVLKFHAAAQGPRALDAELLAGEIEQRGPLLFKDPLNRNREVYVHHVGDDPRSGWLAVRAYASRVSLDCLLRWDAGAARFVDPCSGESFPPDARGLVTYPADVTDGEVRVDLRAPATPADPGEQGPPKDEVRR